MNRHQRRAAETEKFDSASRRFMDLLQSDPLFSPVQPNTNEA